METANRHTIERINLEATMPEAGFSTQEALGSWLKDVACPAIAAACDELLPHDAYLRLEQLELDLGVFPSLDVDLPRDRNLLTDRLVRQLRLALGEHFLKVRHEASLRGPAAAQPEAVSKEGAGKEEKRLNELTGPNKDSLQPGKDWRGARRFEQWLYFLEHGCLPWWGGAFPATEALAELLAETLATQATARTRLLEVVARSKTAMRRLATDRRHEVAFEALLAAKSALLKAWRNWAAVGEAMEKSTESSAPVLPDHRTWKQTGKENWWRLLLQGDTSTGSVQHYISRAVASLLPDLPENRIEAITQLLVNSSLSVEKIEVDKDLVKESKGSAEAVLRLLLTASDERHTDQETDPAASRTQGTFPEGRSDSALPFKTESSPAAAPLKTEQNSTIENQPASAPDHWYVRHAGLVLVHPFLEPLFTDLGYWQDGAFADQLARQRAVYLTHYLATGDPAGHEEELVLPKLLCGWPVSGEPAVLTAPLTDTELHEADEMLRAVIGHWPAIGEASPEGLREGFFAREARLLRRENDWELTVERKGQDILLGRLAWGISLVRCAWHEVFIKVVW